VPWSFLEGVPEEDRRRLLAATRRKKFARREVLFHDGDPADTVHLLDRGRVIVLDPEGLARRAR
jgi:CRP-like cAMP-binding protein